MQRAEALKGLSREHHEALVLAKHASATVAEPLSAAAQTLRSYLLERWAQQFESHFALEEQTLFPALTRAGHHEPPAIVLAEHAALRVLVERLREGDAFALALWGDAMASHVSFEERTLFPLAQTVFEPFVLADVMKPSVYC